MGSQDSLGHVLKKLLPAFAVQRSGLAVGQGLVDGRLHADGFGHVLATGDLFFEAESPISPPLRLGHQVAVLSYDAPDDVLANM